MGETADDVLVVNNQKNLTNFKKLNYILYFKECHQQMIVIFFSQQCL